MKRKCVFFDRDGIVNESPGPGYVTRWADFRLMPGFVDVLRVCAGKGYAAVIVTNQRGVSKGLMTLEALEDIHARLVSMLGTMGLDLLDILYCTHAEGECECRKPKPGMLLEAARRHDLDLAGSWMIGDSPRDVEAGRAAGCRTIIVGPHAADCVADHAAADMVELKRLVENVLPLV